MLLKTSLIAFLALAEKSYAAVLPSDGLTMRQNPGIAPCPQANNFTIATDSAFTLTNVRFYQLNCGFSPESDQINQLSNFTTTSIVACAQGCEDWAQIGVTTSCSFAIFHPVASYCVLHFGYPPILSMGCVSSLCPQYLLPQ